MSPNENDLSEIGRGVAGLGWNDLDGRIRARVLELLLDAFAHAAEGARLDPNPAFAAGVTGVAPVGHSISTVWFRGAATDPCEAAFVNGTLVHPAERDDGHPGASLHAAATVISAALAVAEAEAAPPRDFLAAVAAGCAAGIAVGRALRPGIQRHRLHPPAIVGTFAAAAAASRAARSTPAQAARCLALAASLAPVAPFESFPRGAPVTDLYGGWPAWIGVSSWTLSRAGLSGPRDVLAAERDGLATFLLHAPLGEPPVLRPEDVLDAEVEPFSACGDDVGRRGARGVPASFRRRLGGRGAPIESAVDGLPEAASLDALASSLGRRA